MPEARIFAGVNVQRILASPIGKEIDSKIQDQAPQLQQIFNATGFDLRRDLQEILVAATGQNRGVILFRGNFDAAKLSSFLNSSGQQKVNYEGVDIMSNPAEPSGSVALLDNHIAVAGDLDQVRAVIGRRNHGTLLPVEVWSRISTLSDKYDIWFQSSGPVMPPNAKISDPRFQQAGDLIKSIQQLSGGVTFSSGVDLAVEVVTHNEKEAASVLGALQLFTGFLTMNQQSPGALKRDAVKLATEGKMVRLALSISGDDLKKAYEQTLQARLRQGTAHTAVPKPRPADTGLVIQGSGSDMGTVHLPPSN